MKRRTTAFSDTAPEHPDLSWSAKADAFYDGREHLRNRPSPFVPTDTGTQYRKYTQEEKDAARERAHKRLEALGYVVTVSRSEST